MVVDDMDYEQIVALYHEDLYRFGFSLTGKADEASELTQEAFCRLLTKGSQLRDQAKVKSWLFTTLYRVFLGWKRHTNRFPHLEIDSVSSELPVATAEMVDSADGELVMEALLEVDERYRIPLTLFYLQCLSYREIANLVGVPIGTVMSRLSRGKEILRQRLAIRLAETQPKIIPLDPIRQRRAE